MKTLAALFIAQAMATIVAADGFVKNPQNGHYYKVVHVRKGISWSEAKVAAEKAGGYLATITSVEETGFIGRLVRRDELWESNSPYDNFGPWIGGYQERNGREPDQGWKWVTGENFFYTNWASMEPSGRWKNKNENRLHLYCKSSQRQRAYWNDSLDSPEDVTIRGYIIEKGAIDPEPQDIVITEAINEIHEFRSTTGKTCLGRVLGYNPNNGNVTIAKNNKGSHTVNLGCFSKADQIYVLEWHMVKEFFNPNRLKVKAQQKQIGDESEIEFHDNEGNQRQRQTMINMAYDVVLDNRSCSDLKNLTADYCIYYEQERPTPRGPRADKGLQCGKLRIGTLAGRAKVKFETEHVVLSKREFFNYKGDAVLKGKIEGIWIRIVLPLANGQKAMRECSIPKTLMKDRKWATSDIIVE